MHCSETTPGSSRPSLSGEVRGSLVLFWAQPTHNLALACLSPGALAEVGSLGPSLS